MKPKASLKSLHVNFLLMASRPFTSLQPLSLARALWRAAPVNFSAMVRTSCSPRLCHESPCAGHSQRRPERLPNREQSRRLVCAEGPHVLVAIAGPLVNVAIAIALVLLAGARVNAGDLYTVESPHTSMIDRLAAVNLFLAVFNLIPAFPMDGGRVLRAILAARMGYVRATEIAAFIGQGFAFALGFIGLFFNPLLIFIAIFVYLAASSEAHLVAIRAMSRGVPTSAAMMTQFAPPARGLARGRAPPAPDAIMRPHALALARPTYSQIVLLA